jgi:hypothetical protein
MLLKFDLIYSKIIELFYPENAIDKTKEVGHPRV